MAVPEKQTWSARLKRRGAFGLSASQFGAALGLSGCVSDFVAYHRDIVGTEQEFRGNAMTAHGIDTEPLAKLVYELLTRTSVDDGGFFVEGGVAGADEARLACSPDGIIQWRPVAAPPPPSLPSDAANTRVAGVNASNQIADPCTQRQVPPRTEEQQRDRHPPITRTPVRLLEIKSPYRAFYSGERDANKPFGIPRGYMCQMQGQMAIAGADECDFFVFLREPRMSCVGVRVHRCDAFWAWARPKLLEVAGWIALDARAYKIATDERVGFLNRSLKFEPFFDFSKIRVEPLIPPTDLVRRCRIDDPRVFPVYARPPARTMPVPPAARGPHGSSLVGLLAGGLVGAGDVVTITVVSRRSPGERQRHPPRVSSSAAVVVVCDDDDDGDDDVCVMTPPAVRKSAGHGGGTGGGDANDRGALAALEELLPPVAASVHDIASAESYEPVAVVACSDAPLQPDGSARPFAELLVVVADRAIDIAGPWFGHPGASAGGGGQAALMTPARNVFLTSTPASQSLSAPSPSQVRVSQRLALHDGYRPCVSRLVTAEGHASLPPPRAFTALPLVLRGGSCSLRRGALVLVVPPSSAGARPAAIVRYLVAPAVAAQHQRRHTPSSSPPVSAAPRHHVVVDDAVRVHGVPAGYGVKVEPCGPATAGGGVTVVLAHRAIALGYDIVCDSVAAGPAAGAPGAHDDAAAASGRRAALREWRGLLRGAPVISLAGGPRQQGAVYTNAQPGLLQGRCGGLRHRQPLPRSEGAAEVHAHQTGRGNDDHHHHGLVAVVEGGACATALLAEAFSRAKVSDAAAAAEADLLRFGTCVSDDFVAGTAAAAAADDGGPPVCTAPTSAVSAEARAALDAACRALVWVVLGPRDDVLPSIRGALRGSGHGVRPLTMPGGYSAPPRAAPNLPLLVWLDGLAPDELVPTPPPS